MPLATTTPEGSKPLLWTGRILRGLSILFLFVDGAMKLVRPAPVTQAFADLGFPASTVVPIGVTLLLCVALYALPRTRVLGAILLTGYLGGAVATHVQAGSPLFTHTLFPVYVGILAWGGAFLGDARLRALVPVCPPPARQASHQKEDAPCVS